MLMNATITDTASVLNALINMVLLVAVFIAKWELSKIEHRIQRIEGIFFDRGVKEIARDNQQSRG